MDYALEYAVMSDIYDVKMNSNNYYPATEGFGEKFANSKFIQGLKKIWTWICDNIIQKIKDFFTGIFTKKTTKTEGGAAVAAATGGSKGEAAIPYRVVLGKYKAWTDRMDKALIEFFTNVEKANNKCAEYVKENGTLARRIKTLRIHGNYRINEMHRNLDEGQRLNNKVLQNSMSSTGEQFAKDDLEVRQMINAADRSWENANGIISKYNEQAQKEAKGRGEVKQIPLSAYIETAPGMAAHAKMIAGQLNNMETMIKNEIIPALDAIDKEMNKNIFSPMGEAKPSAPAKATASPYANRALMNMQIADYKDKPQYATYSLNSYQLEDKNNLIEPLKSSCNKVKNYLTSISGKVAVMGRTLIDIPPVVPSA